MEEEDFDLRAEAVSIPAIQADAPVWQPDEEALICNECMSKFTLLLRRHHCRVCGLVFCDACCPRETTVTRKASLTPDSACQRTQSPGGFLPSPQSSHTSVTTNSASTSQTVMGSTLGASSSASSTTVTSARVCTSCIRLPVEHQSVSPLWDIGCGSFGSVKVGLIPDGRWCAIKHIPIKDMGPGSENEAAIENVVKEVNLMRQLDHPNIVRYLGSHVASSATKRELGLYFFLEYISGGSLFDLLGRLPTRKLPVPVAFLYLRDVLHGVAYLHKSGFAHRDIKCQNILICFDTGRAKVSDFGTACTIKKKKKQATTFVGTPHWMAPEVFLSSSSKGDGYDAKKADVWSIGCTTVEMLTGKTAWPSDVNPMLLLHEMMKDSCKPTGYEEEEIPEDFRPFLDVCFKRDPTKRPSPSKLLKLFKFFSTTDPREPPPPPLSSTKPLPPRRQLTERDLQKTVKVAPLVDFTAPFSVSQSTALNSENNSNCAIYVDPSVTINASPDSGRSPNTSKGCIEKDGEESESEERRNTDSPLPLSDPAVPPEHMMPTSPPPLDFTMDEERTVVESLYLQMTGEVVLLKTTSSSQEDSTTEDTYAQAIKEMSLLREYQHRSIVGYFGCFFKETVGRVQFNVLLEFVTGGSLDKLLHKMPDSRLPDTVVRAYTRQLLQALVFLHSKGIAHRSLCLKNVMVSQNMGLVKLRDFAEATDPYTRSARDQAKTLCGTAQVVAPEVIESEEGYDPTKQDVWSLACVVAEMYTGETPWPEFSSPLTLLHVILSSKAWPSNINADKLPIDMADFLSNCFQRKPRKRATASGLLVHKFPTLRHSRW